LAKQHLNLAFKVGIVEFNFSIVKLSYKSIFVDTKNILLAWNALPETLRIKKQKKIYHGKLPFLFNVLRRTH